MLDTALSSLLLGSFQIRSGPLINDLHRTDIPPYSQLLPAFREIILQDIHIRCGDLGGHLGILDTTGPILSSKAIGWWW